MKSWKRYPVPSDDSRFASTVRVNHAESAFPHLRPNAASRPQRHQDHKRLSLYCGIAKIASSPLKSPSVIRCEESLSARTSCCPSIVGRSRKTRIVPDFTKPNTRILRRAELHQWNINAAQRGISFRTCAKPSSLTKTSRTFVLTKREAQSAFFGILPSCR